MIRPDICEVWSKRSGTMWFREDNDLRKCREGRRLKPGPASALREKTNDKCYSQLIHLSPSSIWSSNTDFKERSNNKWIDSSSAMPMDLMLENIYLLNGTHTDFSWYYYMKHFWQKQDVCPPSAEANPHVFSLNEYIAELNPSNFNILNHIFN